VRRFELGSRFWEVEVRYGTLAMRWGAPPTAPQQRELQFRDDTAAHAALAERVAAVLAEGYVEIAPAAVAPPPPVRWWGRFERGAAYLEITWHDHTIRQLRGDTLHIEIDTTSEEASVDAARELVERISRLAIASGYRPVREGEPPALASSCNPALEAQCLAEPDTEAPWAVYADWLLAEGDLRGDLAALRIGGKPVVADQLLHECRAALFGAHADSWVRMLQLSWRHGFAVGARLYKTEREAPLQIHELVRELLAMPIARFVEALQLGPGNWTAAMAAITGSAQAPRIRALRFDYPPGEHGFVSFADFTGAWSKLPALEVLHIRADYGRLGAFELPALRELVREAHSHSVSLEELESIADARYPSLTHLELGLGGVGDGERPLPVLRRLLAAELPRLVHLGFTRCDYLEDVIPILARTPLLARLRTLDLSKGDAGRAAATALARHASSFAHLAWIELDANLLADAQLAQLAKVLPNVRPGTQRRRQRAPVTPRRVKPKGAAPPIRRTKA
jgi:predicted DNA-binding WGR domain protein